MNRIGMNMERVKRQNRSLILSYINENGPVSRTDIAQATGLTAAAVTQITGALIAEGILYEASVSTEKTGAAGRKKVPLDIESNAALVYAVNIEPDETTVAVCGLKGEPLTYRGQKIITRFATDTAAAPEEFLERIAGVCRTLSKDLSGRLIKRIDCVSVGITGLVDVANGISMRAYGIWRKPVNVASILGSALGLPVMVENNVDAFSAAELLYGEGRSENDFLTIKWGPGVGSTVIIGGEIYRGKTGKSAELGHFIVEPGGKLCTCGRRGCLETRLSYRALSEIMHFDLETSFDEAWEAASPETKEQIDEAIDLFARSIVNTGTILAPGRIVLFGGLTGIKSLRDKLIEACKVYDPAYDEDRIIHTTLTGMESYIGPAAVYARQKLFAV